VRNPVPYLVAIAAALVAALITAVVVAGGETHTHEPAPTVAPPPSGNPYRPRYPAYPGYPPSVPRSKPAVVDPLRWSTVVGVVLALLIIPCTCGGGLWFLMQFSQAFNDTHSNVGTPDSGAFERLVKPASAQDSDLTLDVTSVLVSPDADFTWIRLTVANSSHDSVQFLESMCDLTATGAPDMQANYDTGPIPGDGSVNRVLVFEARIPGDATKATLNCSGAHIPLTLRRQPHMVTPTG
jgi:hypothetical protein